MQLRQRRAHRTIRDRARTRARLALVIVGMVAAVLASSVTAHAHTDLVSSSPAQGGEVSPALDRIDLRFGEELLPVGAAIVVHGPDGTRVTVGMPGTSGSTLAADVTLATPGRHTLTYRVVGEDGHAITGDLWFTVTGRPAAGQKPSAASPGAASVAQPLRASVAGEGSSTSWLVPTVALVLVLLLVHGAGARRARVRVRARE